MKSSSNRIQIVLLLLLLIVIMIDLSSPFQYNSKNNYRTSILLKGKMNNEQLKIEVMKYLEIRNKSINDNNDKNDNNDNYNNPLEFIKPKGWYKDLAEADLKARSDSRIPKYLHPLSYVELKRFGFDNLIEEIMAKGGPQVYGSSIGIEWIEPEDEKVIWDEQLRPVREETFNLDMRGSLSLGSSLEEELEQAAFIDLQKLKEEKVDDGYIEYTSGVQVGIDYQDPNWKKAQLKKRGKWVDENKVQIPKSERFSLDGSQRIYLIFTIAVNAFSYGHATKDLIDKNVIPSTLIETSSLASLILLTMSISSIVVNVIKSKEKKRNVFNWGMKGLLGGPFTVFQLNKLEKL